MIFIMYTDQLTKKLVVTLMYGILLVPGLLFCSDDKTLDQETKDREIKIQCSDPEIQCSDNTEDVCHVGKKMFVAAENPTENCLRAIYFNDINFGRVPGITTTEFRETTTSKNCTSVVSTCLYDSSNPDSQDIDSVGFSVDEDISCCQEGRFILKVDGGGLAKLVKIE